jgi:beta-mannanase
MYMTGDPQNGDMAAITNLDNQLRRHSRIVHVYAQWGASWGTFATMRPQFDAIHSYRSVGASGATPLVTWEPWSPPFDKRGRDFPLTAIAGGQYDAYIDSWAQGASQLGYPLLLDWGHEMNGDWYPWGYHVNGNAPAQYIAAFRHIHDRFVSVHADNVQFVWNPDRWSVSGRSAAAFYPGDAFVDWMAIDAYNWNRSWNTPEAEIQPVYREISALNASKPIMLAEVGSEDAPPPGARPVDKAAWIAALAAAIPVSFPRIKAVVWFNERSTQLTLDSSPAALAAARAFCSTPGSG